MHARHPQQTRTHFRWDQCTDRCQLCSQKEGGNNPDWWPLDHSRIADLPNECLHSPYSSQITIAVYASRAVPSQHQATLVDAPGQGLGFCDVGATSPASHIFIQQEGGTIFSDNLSTAAEGPLRSAFSVRLLPSTTPGEAHSTPELTSQPALTGSTASTWSSDRGLLPAPDPIVNLYRTPGEDTALPNGTCGDVITAGSPQRTSSAISQGRASSTGDTAPVEWVGAGLVISEGGSDYETASEEESPRSATSENLRTLSPEKPGKIHRTTSEGSPEISRSRNRRSRPSSAAAWKPPGEYEGGNLVVAAQLDLNELQYVGEHHRL